MIVKKIKVLENGRQVVKWHVLGLGLFDTPPEGIKRTHSEETKKKLSQAHLGKKVSEETRRKLSIAHKGKPSPRRGVRHTEESKKKMSESCKKAWAKEEIKKKIKNRIPSMLGKKMPEEAKKKLSIARKGKKSPQRLRLMELVKADYLRGDLIKSIASRYQIHYTTARQMLKDSQIEMRDDTGKGNTPCKASQETRQKMRQTRLGMRITEETKKKIAEAHRGKKVSEETKKKLRALRGEKNSRYGKKHTLETKDEMAFQASLRTKRPYYPETINLKTCNTFKYK